MVLNAAVQALKLADELKQKVIQENSNPSSPNKTLCVARLQKAYQHILLMDLDFALDKKVEQELWNFGFKNQIEYLQNCAKDKKNSRRAESQTLLSWVLQSATGFYICLLHQICNTFKIELPFRCDFSFNDDNTSFQFSVKPPQLSSCWYIIQHCLVHLGDLARYNRQVRRADSYYRQALNVSPRNGQPYNQLGLLRAARGDKLGAAYYHARSIAVGGPFPPASNNLARTLASASCHNIILKNKTDSPVLDNNEYCYTARLNSQSYINNYIIVHHQLQSGNDLSNTNDSITELNSTLIALVATDEFSNDVLLKMCCLDLYALYSITEGYKIDCTSLSEEEKNIYLMLMKLISGSLAALLLPAHTRASEELISYSALPAIKILLQWIQLHPDVLKEQEFTSRPQIWPGLCTLLNNLQEFVKDFNFEKYETLPLPEDEELQGFLPIDDAFSNLKFDADSSCKQMLKTNFAQNEQHLTSEEINAKMADVLQEHFILKKKSWNFSISNQEPETKKDIDFFNRLRTYRLIKIGEWLSSHFKNNGLDIITFNFDAEKECNVFTSIQNGSESYDVLKTIQQLSLLREKHLNEVNSQNISITNNDDDGDISDSENKNENSSKDNLDDDIPFEGNNPPPIVISEIDIKEKVLEKRAGILKPQGSLEKARCEKALSRSCRIDVSPEPLKLSSDILDTSDIQDTGSSSSTVSQDGTICSDISSLLDPPLLPSDKSNIKKEGKKIRTNIAMQTIMKKQEESSKQVKFLTPATTPDSGNENLNVSPSDNKSQTDTMKIIQPKVLKSLNSIPTDRKTGGILSLKDKSAGYPHLVNTDTTSLTENEKSEIIESISNLDLDSKNATNEQFTFKESDVQKKPNPIHKSAKKNESKKHPESQDNLNSFKQMSYSPWSDGNSGSLYSKDSTAFPGAPNLDYNNWKSDYNFPPPPLHSNNSGCYSYFPTPTSQKFNSGIPLSVVNPKEIDVRSASMQRQKPQIPFDNNPSKYNNYPNMQYDNNMYNCWNSFENNTPMMRNENINKPNNLPPRLMNFKNSGNAYNPQNDKNMPIFQNDNRYINDNSVASPSKNWWKPVEPKQPYNSNQPLFQPNIQNFPTVPQQMVQNPPNFNYQMPSVGQKPANNNIQSHNKFNEDMMNRQTHPLPAQTMGYNNPSNFNPYNQQSNYNPIMYPQYGNNMMMPPNIQTPIGSEFLRNNPEAYRITQNLNIKNASSGNVTYLTDIQKQPSSKDKMNASHNFNTDIPEFVPRAKSTASGSSSSLNNTSAPGNSNTYTYSLFNGPEPPWQTKHSGDNISQQASWLGSGPSPLEKLLEQQKQFKYPPSDS